MPIPTSLEAWALDVRHSIRALAAAPLFTGTAVLALTLGIGANTAIFSVMNAVVLRLLPVHDPARIFAVTCNGQPDGATNTGDTETSFSLPVFDELRRNRIAFSDVMAYVPMGYNKISVRHGYVSEEAAGEMVSGNYFTGLGVGSSCGRLLLPDDERHHTQTAVLGYGYWDRSFEHDCAVVGRSLFIKGVPFTIVGVAAKEFIGLGGTGTDLWVPLQTSPDFNAWGSQDNKNYYADPNWWCVLLAARLAPNVTTTQAEAAAAPGFFHAAYASLGGKPKAADRATTLHLKQVRGLGAYRDTYGQSLKMLLFMVGAVLLIAAGNVSLLFAARNLARRREFSIRLALGASGAQLSRQLLIESMLVTFAGAASGWLLSSFATEALRVWSDIQASLQPDGRVFVFTLGISLLACLIFALYPIVTARRVAVGESLKISASTGFADPSRRRLGRFTAAIQIALCLVLLVGTILMIRSLRNLQSEKLGMRTASLLVFGVDPKSQNAQQDPQQTFNFYRRLLQQLKLLPRVEAVTLAGNRPGSGWSNNTGAILDGKSPTRGQSLLMRWNAVGPDFFGTVGVPILYGRDFRDTDSPNSPKVAIVTKTFVNRYLAGGYALGHTVSFTRRFAFTIVGVAADSKYTDIREGATPIAYFPYEQVGAAGGMHVEIRTGGDPTLLLPEVQRLLRAFDPELSPLQPMTQQQQFEISLTNDRLLARLALFFGFVAMVLVATGLYGTVAFSVNRRISELGIRMALGAQRGEVLRMILREGLEIAFWGVLIGVPLSLAGMRLLKSLLFGLTPGDPLSIAAATITIVLVTCLACVVPARRASVIDPAVALRNE